MKPTFYIRLFALFLSVTPTVLFAQQLKLGDNPSNLQKSALLELESKSQGLLLPRISDTTQATIKTAPDGMIIFLTLNNSLYIRANGSWQKLIPEGQAIKSMNGSTVPVQTITTTSNAAPASITTTAGNHFINLPDASSSYSGFMGTGIQTFAGDKTFNGNLTANQDFYLTGIAVDNTKDSVLLINSGKVWKKQLTGLPPIGAAGGDLTGTYPNPVIAAGAVTGAKMAQAGATTGQTLEWNGTTWAPATDDGITSVGLTLPSLFTVTNSPLTANGTIAATLQSQTANTIFAAPNGAAGTPTFRTLAAADIPALPFSNITGIVPIAQGGTALNAVGAAGTVLTSNGTNLSYVTPSVTLAGDVTGASGANVIAAKAVTYAKIQDVNTQKILGRYTASTGSVQEVSLDNSIKLTTAGILYADSSLAIWNASRFLGRALSPTAPTAGQILKWNGATWAPAADDNSGTLTSVGLTLPSIFSVTNSPLTANGTIAATLQSQTANTVFAAPDGAAGTPAFRALAAADIPALPFSNITGIVPIAQGGTALSTVGANGTFLTSNGTAIAYRTLTATDIPSLPFSKITGTVPTSQGGTGLTAVGAAGTVLTSDGTNLSYVTPSVTLAGDVTGASGANVIAAKAVTYAKIQDVNTQKILGRYTASTGSVQEVSLDNSIKLTTAGILYADSSLAIWNASRFLGRALSPTAPTAGQILKWNGATWAPAADDNSGTLTSVGLTLPSIFSVTNSPLTANGTIAATLQSQTANTVFAAPNGSAGAPTFRTLVAADIPALPFSNITGIVPIAQGGTNLSTVGAAGTVLTSNGTILSYVTPSVTLAGDVTGASGANVIAAKAVTYAKIQDVNTQKILGRYTASTGSVQEVSLDNSIKLTTAGILYADSSLAIWNASRLLGRSLSPTAPTVGQILKWNGATWGSVSDDGLTSVGLTLPSIFSVTNSPLTANGTIAATLQSQTANTVFAAPNGSAGAPTFRTLAAADIPALPFSNITGIVPIAQGGTNLSAVGAAGTVLTSNGTNLSYVTPSVTLAGDVTGASGANVIAAKAVTYAKIQDVTTQKLLGRYTAGTGTVQEVTLDNSVKLTTAGTLYADSSLAIWNASALQGRRISGVAPTDNYILRWDAATSTWGPEAETSASNWLFTGNSNTTATSFLGTTVDQPMVLKYNNNELFRGTKGTGIYASKTVSLFNGATSYNGHPVVIKANGPDVLAFQDSVGTLRWHWNLLGPANTTGLNFVESNVADYRLFLQPGGNVGINTGTPSATLDVEGTVQFGVGGSVLTNIIKVTGTTTGAISPTTTTPVTVTFTVTGALTTGSVIVSPQAAFPTPSGSVGALAIGVAYVSAANTVSVRFINTSTNAVTLPTNSKFNITVIN